MNKKTSAGWSVWAQFVVAKLQACRLGPGLYEESEETGVCRAEEARAKLTKLSFSDT